MKAAQTPAEDAPSVKVVVVGDGGCGKTSLLLVFTQGNFPERYTPTVFERYAVDLQMKGKPVCLQIWDTAGQDDYDRLRPLFYSDANVLLLCFDVTSPSSFENVFNRWYPEVTHFCKGVPIIVVGCKTDLRKDKVLGQDMARSVGAVAYFECSARLHDNVHAIFQEAAEVALSSRSRNLWRRITQSFCVVT
ncbi:rho-related GTP-binding protein RhoD isoform X2 [Perognathus longimembris pacificus]|uniref:rho-related GTP-binding protein RhoD isoform X2 n=1 Tax=Perognathus longimembris pacificus TaxID=214514 RepID=UPI002019A3E9|nr:rho-related GTP-binding protein RhoD isoform X2 [Perognathus longimembris pacificus]